MSNIDKEEMYFQDQVAILQKNRQGLGIDEGTIRKQMKISKRIFTC